MASGFALGLNTAQMNRPHDYGDGNVDNQLRTLDHIGLFSKPLVSHYKPKKGEVGPDGGPAKKPKVFEDLKLPKLADPYDDEEPAEARARSYMASNCAHCHRRWGGGNAQFQLQAELPLDATGIVGVPPSHGDLGIKDAKLIAPGKPDGSMILQRMTRLDKLRMPRLASSVVDEAAVKMMREWIEGMGKDAQ